MQLLILMEGVGQLVHGLMMEEENKYQGKSVTSSCAICYNTAARDG